MTHSKNSPYSRIDKGSEFPVEEHPEISRDHEMRPFEIYEGVLIRKDDNLPISLVDISLEHVPQQSTANIYDLADTETLEVPFYYTDRMKGIHLNKEDLDGLKLKDFYVLDKISSHLRIETFNLEKIPRNNNIKQRYTSFIQYLAENKIKHDANGIAYEDPNYEVYEQFLNDLLKANKLV